MATYEEIRNYVKIKHGQYVQNCWIAHVKEMCGLNPKAAHNRLSVERKKPCRNEEIKNFIIEALQYFKMVN